MNHTIFYSWQTDSPSKCNKQLIRNALDDAVASLGALNVDESPRVDSGMDGISGTPEVASVMFEKIASSAFFLADMTLVGTVKSDSSGLKLVPNSNVLLEMGFAAGTMGWGRIICVMNEHFGKRDQLPFDVRNRRYPIDYFCSPDGRERDEARRNLAKYIARAITIVRENDYEKVNQVISRIDIDSIKLIRAFHTFEGFTPPAPNTRTFGGALDTDAFRSGVARLLDLGMIKFIVHEGNDAYFWTYLGSQVLIKLGFRK